jgi:hypothetical protein
MKALLVTGHFGCAFANLILKATSESKGYAVLFRRRIQESEFRIQNKGFAYRSAK